MSKDPVCGMEVKSPSKFSLNIEGKNYEFCSESCQSKFALDPNKYIDQPKETTATYSVTSYGTEKIKIPVIGIHCNSCVPSIEKEIKKLPGIKLAKVNFGAEEVHVEYDRRKTNSIEIVNSIKKAGFKAGSATLKLGIGKMHCASCVTKIEEELNSSPGILSTSVDLGTDSAIIKYLPSLINASIVKNIIEKLGYKVFDSAGIRKPAAEIEDTKVDEAVVVDENQAAREKEYKTLMFKFIFAAIIAVPVIIFSYPKLFSLPAQFQRGSDTLSLVWMAMSVLSLPVMFWSGSQFYVGALAASKNRSANMHTLIAVGITAAWLYSSAATYFPNIFPAAELADQFFDVISVVVALVVLGMAL